MKIKARKILAVVLCMALLSACKKGGDEVDEQTTVGSDQTTVMTDAEGKPVDPAEVIASVYPYAEVYDSLPEIVIDSTNIRGSAVVETKKSGMSVSYFDIQLLSDYKTAKENVYNEMMSALFAPSKSVGFGHVALEISDSDTDFAIEKLFSFAKDAYALNNGLTFEIAASFGASDGDFSAKLKFIERIMSDFEKTVGTAVTYVRATDSVDLGGWVTYLAGELDDNVKVVGVDNSDMLIDLAKGNIELLDALDVIMVSSPSTAAGELCEKYNKEIWGNIDVENIPQISNKNPDINPMISAAELYISSNAARVVYNSPIAANSVNRSLLTAASPNSGNYDTDIALWGIIGFNNLTNSGMRPVALLDYEEIPDVKILAFQEVTSGEYTLAVVNNSLKTQKLTFTTVNCLASDKLLHIWQTAGDQYDGQAHYEAFFQSIEDFYAVEYGLDKYADLAAQAELEQERSAEAAAESEAAITEAGGAGENVNSDLVQEGQDNAGETTTIPEIQEAPSNEMTAPVDANEEEDVYTIPYSYSLEFVPYSVTFVSTMDIAKDALDSWELYLNMAASTSLELPYSENFDGGLKNITAVGAEFVADGGKLVQQQSNGLAHIGSELWGDYEMAVDFTLSGEYADIGVRGNFVPNGKRFAGYIARVYEDGKVELLKSGTPIASGTASLSSSNNAVINAQGNTITVKINGAEVIKHEDTFGYILTGGVVLGGSSEGTSFDNLSITQNEQGRTYEKINAYSNNLKYISGWRTDTSTGITTMQCYEGGAVEFETSANGFAIVGAGSETATITLSVGGTQVGETIGILPTNSYECRYVYDFATDDAVTVRIDVRSGDFAMDSIVLY